MQETEKRPNHIVRTQNTLSVGKIQYSASEPRRMRFCFSRCLFFRMSENAMYKPDRIYRDS